ncbi:MAG: hypothetical protein US86_C0001G0117 [Candidatus Daviesbacteria bacterium GW2011_GWA2_38_24]|uniref:Acyltransferase 3 domain-containing protein n=1 Tax=Candidatus Daviesbacteria bacterium GW2011_GWA2_38_24 TaxID=1618422 RepID=A0A0G0JVS2_9BACT|nr:MAG: hypothetical protein US86_C0001G0117 [Candidatus Daviesbacteria bacterium GW2011_GWA2_38_24]KKQ81040.1 MAG: hypothetical protein UT01_C0001G0023 [Candidatus Daviesbacteria bacterium GW2011_GWA1_38_7]OGE23296.1 MAG: hypothetical protein A2688_04280 [Candidatus Daviesbacteria bacterium RIFCSPHIGHO2_01_FULL_38_8]
MENNPNHLNHLQLLRAVAALLVVMYHTYIFSDKVLNYKHLNGMFISGFSGVDLFFVLSGFIILYVHGQDMGKISKFKPYLIKRFARVFPIYWLINLLVIPLYFILPQFGQGYETEFKTIVKSLLLLPQSNLPIISVAWTLIHEMRFYIIFSLAILLGIKKFWPVSWLILSITLTFYFLRVAGIKYQTNFITGFLFSYYNLEFLLGCLGAYLVQKNRLKASKGILMLGVLSFLFSNIYYKIYSLRLDDSLRILFFGLPSALIVTSLAIQDKIKSSNIPKLLLLIGNASYSIYLTHQIIISIATRVLIASGIQQLIGLSILMMLSATVAVSVGIAIHLYLEKPMVFYTRKLLLPQTQTSF